MKRLIIAVCIIIFCLGATAYAGEETTSGPSHKHFNDHINGKLDKYLDHDHKYVDTDTHKERRDAQKYGVKTDLLKFEKADVTAKFARDTANGENEYEVLVETKLEDGLLQVAYNKLKGILPFGGGDE